LVEGDDAVLVGQAAQLVRPDAGLQGDPVQEDDRWPAATLDEVHATAVRGADHMVLDIAGKPQLRRPRAGDIALAVGAQHRLADRETGPGGKGSARSTEGR
jgi:hypothetical protein